MNILLNFLWHSQLRFSARNLYSLLVVGVHYLLTELIA